MKHKLLFLGLLLIITLPSIAQKYHSLTGALKDLETGMPVKDASIIVQKQLIGTLTNKDGRFSLFLKEADYLIDIEKEGFEKQTIKLVLNQDVETEVFLNTEKVPIRKGFRIFASKQKHDTAIIASTL